MRLVLAGADYEENLGMGMIAAAAEAAGHRTAVVPFGGSGSRAASVRRILALDPDVVGLAAQFQHRGLDYLALASDLRRAGYRGHITAGGQFATMAATAILSGGHGVDSVVLYEGESTIVDLLEAVAGRRPFERVPGLVIPDGKGGVYRTPPRCLTENLDTLPLAHRYRRHSRQLGIPFIPVSGSRGCWASCTFCSITSVLRDGREHGVPGRRLRLRSPEDVGLEMAMLAQAVGGSAVFCFHDENFLLPRPADSLARVEAIRQVLDEQGVARAAIVGKCRPDTVSVELARELARLGVIRMYVGIENASPRGALHLNRRVDVATMASALDAFANAGIFVCYNLLVFEPEATLDDVATNLAFMRAHADTPVNFCRAEPYIGTPMHRRLATTGNLQGGFLGCDYRIADDRAELLFRICASAFREHNFATEGVANRYMSLGYSAKLLEVFYPDGRGRVASFMERARELTRSITFDTAEAFERALDIAAKADISDHDLITRQTALLGLRVADSDRQWHAALDALERDMAAFARGEARSAHRATSRTARVAQGAAMAGWLALWATGCGKGAMSSSSKDARALDAKADLARTADGPLVADMLPPDSGARRDGAGRQDGIIVVDPLPPPDSGVRGDVASTDAPPEDAGVRDVAGDGVEAIDGTDIDAEDRDTADGPTVVDPPPQPIDARPEVRDTRIDEPPFIVDPVVEAREGLIVPPGEQERRIGMARQHWAFISPTRLKRSSDLPLCLCPEIRLAGEWQHDKVRARLAGVAEDFSSRWQAQGMIEGEGAEVLWVPSSDEDQLDVAVRTADGVTVTMLRLENVAGTKAG